MFPLLDPPKEHQGLSKIFGLMQRLKPTGWRRWKPRKYHTPQWSKEPPASDRTRQLTRAGLRLEEYRKFGPGTHARPLYNESRRVLRAIARSSAARRYREQTTGVKAAS